jgi:hypothetical protein
LNKNSNNNHNNLNNNHFNHGDGQVYTQSAHENTKDFFNQDLSDIPATENYNLPSELPPISAHLPGLINSLMEEKWMQTNNVTDEEITTTTQEVITTTRKPNTRGRRPVPTSTSYRTSTESSYERKPATRGRRPSQASRSTVASATEYPSRSTPSRSSKVKYNISSDDQSKFRTRTRKPQRKEEENIEYQRDVLNQNYPSSTPRAILTTSQPLTTQQSFDQSDRIVESIHLHSDERYNNQQLPTADHVNDYNAPIESVEVIPLGGNNLIHEHNNNNNNIEYTPDNPLYYENTIVDTTSTTTELTSTTHKLHRNHKYNSNDEQYQIPQHKTVSHRLKGNFNFNRNIDSFYKQQDTKISDTTPVVHHEHTNAQDDDEILVTVPTTISTTTTTTTTEAPETEAPPVTRRTSFPRRRLYTTTAEPAHHSDGETQTQTETVS